MIAHSPMVHARVSESYIHFTVIDTTDHIFLVLPIKYLINEYSKPTRPFKLETGTEPSILHLRVYFFQMLYKKLLHMLGQRR